MKITPALKETPAFIYASKVESGEIVTGQFIKLAVKRFYTWIENAEVDGFYLDHDAGMRILKFFPAFINHTKGEKAGTPFELELFKKFTCYNFFECKNTKNDSRRIKKVYDKRAKKNGKSAEMAAAALYVLADDNEAEAEIYVGATKEEQAKICWLQAKQFIESPVANPLLKYLGFSCRLKEIRFKTKINEGKMSALGGDSKTQDGINSHISIIDEYHAHKDDSVKENLESSSIQRKQPLMYHITTAGTNIQSVCFNYEQVCKDILLGTKAENNSLWVMIHELDETDDWENSENWVKANPLVGAGLELDRLKEEYDDAVLQPSKQTNFKTKHLNMWVDAPSAWIYDKTWMQNKDKPKLKNFIKYGCAGGLDLSTTTDLTALAFISNPDKKGFHDLITFVFCPKETIDRRSKEDKVPYRHWSELKYNEFIDIPKKLQKKFKHLNNDATVLIATEGPVVDYNVLQDYVQKYFNLLNCTAVLYDRMNSTQLVTNLEEKGVEMLKFAQTISYYSFPTKEFEKLALSGKLRHGANPILRWCLTGCGVYIDTNENVRLSKKHSSKRIDPLIASVMGMAGILQKPEKSKKQSAYNDDSTEFYA